jgi:outer membrane receptor protein involved in Fe transport
VAVLDKSTLEASGLTTVGDILQKLPAQSNAINVQFNNGGDGSTRVNLRGLGSQRTLVLLNGRRVVPGGIGADTSVDLNAIPLTVIERVEVLKDGASAVYGSDAIAGVVNIITRQNFNGTEGNAYIGTSQRGDAFIYDLSAVTGHTSSKSNILFSAGFTHQGPVWAGDRDWSLYQRDLDWKTGKVQKIGSTSIPSGYLNTDGNGDGMPDMGNAKWVSDVLNNCKSMLCTRSGLNTPWRDFIGASHFPNDYYNFQPVNYLATPLDRYNIFSQGDYKFNDRVRGFFEALYLNRSSTQQLAPVPLQLDQLGVPISAASIYNPFGLDIAYFRRRMNETGFRITSQNVGTFRIVAGLDGQIPDTVPHFKFWKWDVSYNFGRTDAYQVANGALSKSRIANAIGPSFVDPATGAKVCGTPTNPIPGCVPLDLLSGPGSITPDMANYLRFTGGSTGYNQQQTALAQARGPIAQTPWGGFAALAIGADFRREAAAYTPDPFTAAGDTTEVAAQPIAGSYNVVEGFAELNFVPVTEQGPAKWLELDGAIRGFDYSSFGSGFTWKGSGLFRTVGGLAVRGTYSTAFRAPSVSDLYSGTQDNFPLVRDPCDTSMGPLNPVVAQRCLAQGVPASYVNQNQQTREKVGGNPKLQAETANTVTGGLIFEPPAVKGLSFTFDYFNINIDNAIQPLGATVIIANCYQAPVSTGCNSIHRLTGTHVIDYIDDPRVNVGGNDTSGLDFSVAYQRQFKDAGNFRLAYDGTLLFEFDQTTAARTIAGLGVYDLGVYPRLRSNFIIQWARGHWNAGSNVRYVAGYKECQQNDCIPEDMNPSRHVDAYVVGDIFGGYEFKSPAGTTRITVGINNIADSDPPFIVNGFLANSDASTYDYLGRYFYFRATQQF